MVRDLCGCCCFYFSQTTTTTKQVIILNVEDNEENDERALQRTNERAPWMLAKWRRRRHHEAEKLQQQTGVVVVGLSSCSPRLAHSQKTARRWKLVSRRIKTTTTTTWLQKRELRARAGSFSSSTKWTIDGIEYYWKVKVVRSTDNKPRSSSGNTKTRTVEQEEDAALEVNFIQRFFNFLKREKNITLSLSLSTATSWGPTDSYWLIDNEPPSH